GSSQDRERRKLGFSRHKCAMAELARVESISVESKAYVKLMLHAAKHPSCPVNGLLLVRQSQSKGDGDVYIVDAVPMFHLRSLAPLLESAAMLTEAYATELGEGITIGGVYTGSSALDDSGAGRIAGKMCDRVEGNSSEGIGAVLLQVNNKKLALPTEAALQGFGRDSGRGFKREVPLTLSEGSVARFNKLLAEGAAQHVNDMDEHFDDVSKDWSNKHLDD
ncbi:unnamed protein product, partial [Chrysoparadoxa australica]